MIWCLRRHNAIQGGGSLFNFFLVERNLKQELQGKEESGKMDKGELGHYALLHHQAVLHMKHCQVEVQEKYL